MVSLFRMPAPLGLDATLVRRAASLAFAAWLSFALASRLHVHNAYWAAMPVWVITQTSRGLLFERAVLRVLGTLLGAAAGFAIMHLPLTPAAQLAALAFWIALTAGLTHLLRGMHGYAAVLAGMTAAIVVAPSALLAQTASMEIALARVECTLIGVVVGTLVLAWLTPAQPLADFFAEVRLVAAATVAHAARALRDGVAAESDAEVRKTLARISQLEASARLAVAASVEGYRRLHDVELAVVGMLSLLAAARSRGRTPTLHDAALAERLDLIARHLRQPWRGPLRAEYRYFAPEMDAALGRFLQALDQIFDAEHGFYSPHTRTARPETRHGRLAPHREWPLARLNAAMAGTACLAVSAASLWLAWPDAWLVLLGVCIFMMLLGSMPLPQQIAPKLFVGTLAGVACAVFYRLAIQPRLASPSDVLISLVPFLLVGGIVRVAPRTAAVGLDACMSFLLASQAGVPATADLARILSESGALLLAAGVVVAVFLVKPRQPLHRIEEAAAAIRADLLRMFDDGVGIDSAEWHARSARQILRLILHLSREQALGERWPGGLLAVLNFGHATIALHDVGMPVAVVASLRAFLRREASLAATHEALAAATSVADGRQALAIRALDAELVRAGVLLAFGR